jgi:hypothetical protein
MHRRLSLFIALLLCFSCGKVEDLLKDPELTPLEEGFKSSAAIAYCVSLASRAYTGKSLPPNVSFTGETKEGYTSAGLIYVDIDDNNKLPFLTTSGQIVISGIWDGTSGGVISILFADVDILNNEYKFYGLHTIPVQVKPTGEIVAIFAEQDIVIGEGSETLLNLSLSKPEFNLELDRVNEETPADVFVAVTQNVWHITIDAGNDSDLSDDLYEITGGGQIISTQNNSAGVFYHAMINTRFSMDECSRNPIYGTAFIQNLQAGSVIDLGTILIDFHNACDGKAEVTLATGKYAVSNGRDITLGWN